MYFNLNAKCSQPPVLEPMLALLAVPFPLLIPLIDPEVEKLG